MAGFDDFLRQHLANTNRGYTTDPNGTPVVPPQVQPITTIPNQPTPLPLPTPMGGGGPTMLAAGGGTRPPGVKNPYPVAGDGTGGPMYRDDEERLALFMWLLQQNGGYPLNMQTRGSNMPTTLSPAGALPGTNPNPRMDLIGVPGVGNPQPSFTRGDGTGGQSPKRAGLDALIADAKQKGSGTRYEDGSSDPSYQMSAPVPQRGPMNPIQQAAMVALAKIKGMQ